MDKTPLPFIRLLRRLTLASKISPLHCASHDPMHYYYMICGTEEKGLPHRIMSIICNSFSLCLSPRVTTKLSEGLHLQAQQKSTAKKVATSSGFSFTVTSSGGLLFSYPFSFVLFYISLRRSSKSE